MRIFKTIDSVVKEIKELRSRSLTIGFVPTMGALHKGHLSLIRHSAEDNDITVVSIFVNPLQFSDKQEIINYPGTLEEDIEKLEGSNCEVLFAPSKEEMFRETEYTTYDFGHLENIMEGKFRQGHFNGVATVVHKLLKIITPDKAYFGEKDFQQLVIINKLVRDYRLPVQIIPCPAVREDDGLAVSSRNKLLTKKQREDAALISEVLFEARDKAPDLSVEEIKEWVISQIRSNRGFDLEYFEIVDSVELKDISKWSGRKDKIGCIAVKVGNVRLIDNILFNMDYSG